MSVCIKIDQMYLPLYFQLSLVIFMGVNGDVTLENEQ